MHAVTLAEVLDGCRDREIHWLKIDVEGAEEHVLTSWLPAAARPWIVVVESVSPDTRADCSQDWEPALLALGYRCAYFDGLNRYYVAASHADLAAAFACGPNVFDDFTLSGTSSAPFCHALKERREADHAAYRHVLAEQRDQLMRHAENLKAAHLADQGAWENERAGAKQYIDSILGWGKTSEAYAQSLEEERAKLYAMQEESARRIAFLEQSLAGNSKTDAWIRK